MGADGQDTPQLGDIRIDRNSVLTFDGTTWRPIGRIPDSGETVVIRGGKIVEVPVDEPESQPETDGPAQP
jgi:hypothetical protein